ncbi:MAG: signal peptidase I [Lachnospiraceae bacterium]|nr:signal peptidase I [Lachnospiraceae bacterium]
MGRKRSKEQEIAEDDFLEGVEEEQPKSPLREALGMVVYMGIVLGVTFLIITYVGQRTHVSGDSMKNTLNDGDHLIVDKITYRMREPVRYDIIVFPFRYKENTFYIKRIIGLPGETVQIAGGEIYIDGEILKESYGREVIKDPGIAESPIELGEDEYFVLGDNRNESSDSRDPSVGKIRREEIVGRAWLRIWPLNKFGILKHQ